MENYYIRNFEKLWNIDSTIIQEIDDFETLLKILSSGKLKNDIIWQVMHDWMSVDTFNRLTHFKQFFKKCFQLDNQSQKFIKNEVFPSKIFRLLPINFQTELEEFAEKMLQPSYTKISESASVVEHILLLPEKDKPPKQLPVAESISLPNIFAHFVTENSKQLLVCIDQNNGSTQFYNPNQHSWHSSPVSLKLPNEQHYYQLALLGSMLYAFGGIDDDCNPTNLMWSRDLSDPSSQWTARANMKQSRKWFCSVVLNDNIYALGGKFKDYNSKNQILRSCERYCTQLNEWSTVADMNSDCNRESAAVINGCIYVAGGVNGRRVLKSVFNYCPETNTWREVAPMTTQRLNFALTPFAGRLWAIGGMGGDYHHLSSCESYDPVTDTWREEAPMKGWKCDHAAIEFNGELYVVDGWSNGGLTEKYVPTIGWVEDSQLRQEFGIPQLLIIPLAYSSFFTTDPKKKSINKTLN